MFIGKLSVDGVSLGSTSFPPHCAPRERLTVGSRKAIHILVLRSKDKRVVRANEEVNEPNA